MSRVISVANSRLSDNSPGSGCTEFSCKSFVTEKTGANFNDSVYEDPGFFGSNHKWKNVIVNGKASLVECVLDNDDSPDTVSIDGMYLVYKGFASVSAYNKYQEKTAAINKSIQEYRRQLDKQFNDFKNKKNKELALFKQSLKSTKAVKTQ